MQELDRKSHVSQEIDNLSLILILSGPRAKPTVSQKGDRLGWKTAVSHEVDINVVR